LLGVVPESAALSRSSKGKKGARDALPAGEAEAFHLIRAHLRYFNVDRELRTLLIASAAPGDGKTGCPSRGKLELMSFTRITVRVDQMGGVPCIRGLRIPVATVVGMVADGMSDSEILAAYPDLEAEDIREAVRYAAEAVRERELPLAASG
jgi:uncharacterized protein (DUF433 family)